MIELFVKINDSPFVKTDGGLIEINEGDYIQFRIKTTKATTYHVAVGDGAIDLSLNSAMCSASLCYESLPNQFFKGYIGHATGDLFVGDSTEVEAEFRFSVLATQVTSKRAVSFLKFILSNDDFSVPYLDATQGRAGAEGSHFMESRFTTGVECLREIEKSLMRLTSRKPCLRSENPMGADFIHKMATNPENWTAADDGSADIVLPSGIGLRVNAKGQSIEKPLMETSNEQLFVVQFMRDFAAFLSSRSHMVKRVEANTEGDMVSIDQVLSQAGVSVTHDYGDAMSLLNGIQSHRLWSPRLKSLQSSFNWAHAKFSDPALAALVAKIREYFSVAREDGSLQGDRSNYLLGLKNIPKMYEYVCLILLVKGLKSLGYKLISVDQGAAPDEISSSVVSQEFYFERDEECLTLYYDKRSKGLFELQETDSLGEMVDVKHNTQWTWRPDFCIVHKKSKDDSWPAVHILDAKCTSEEIARTKRMPASAQKYLGFLRTLRRDDKGRLVLVGVDSLTILFSERDTDVSYVNEAALSKAPDFLSINEPLPLAGAFGLTEGCKSNVNGLLRRLGI